MKPVRDLQRLWCALSGAVRVRAPAIAAHDLYRGMLAEPHGQRLRRAIRQQVEHLVRLRFTRIVP